MSENQLAAYSADTPNSLLLFPLYDDLDAFLEWDADCYDIPEQLEEIAEHNRDFDIKWLLDKRPPLLIFSNRKKHPVKTLKLVFVEPLDDAVYCKFWEKESNRYSEDLEIPASTEVIEIYYDQTRSLHIQAIRGEPAQLPVSTDPQPETDASSLPALPPPPNPAAALQPDDDIETLHKKIAALEELLSRMNPDTSAQRDVDEVSRENERLRKVITEMSDRELLNFTQTGDSEIDDLTRKICAGRVQLQAKLHSMDELKKEEQRITADIDAVRENNSELLSLIFKSQQILDAQNADAALQSEQLKQLLDRLHMNEETLKLYNAMEPVANLTEKVDALTQDIQAEIQRLAADCQAAINSSQL